VRTFYHHTVQQKPGINDQPRDQKGDRETHKEEIGDRGGDGLKLGCFRGVIKALSDLQKDVGEIVAQENRRAHTGEVNHVRAHDQRNGDYVVENHLQCVTAVHFGPMELVNVTTQLDLIVEIHQRGDWVVGPVVEVLGGIQKPRHAGGPAQRDEAQHTEGTIEHASPHRFAELHHFATVHLVAVSVPDVFLYFQLTQPRLLCQTCAYLVLEANEIVLITANVPEYSEKISLPELCV